MWIIQGNGTRVVHAYDLEDPQLPSLVGTWSAPQPNADEVSAAAGRAWLAWVGGFSVLRREGDTIVEELSFTTPFETTPHNVLPVADGDFLLVAEEAMDASVSVWDLTVSPPEMVHVLLDGQAVMAVMNLEPGVDEHVYLNALGEGLKVFNLADPRAPKGPYIHDVAGLATDCAHAGDFIAIADDTVGLQLVRFYPEEVR